MIDKDDLINWLEKADKILDNKIEIIAVGGTAMTLLGLKSSTVDVDFCLDKKDVNYFKKVIDNEFRVDIFTDGFIFSEQLPSDYKEKSKEIRVMKNIILKALDPVDIIITKAARFNARDSEDIEALAKHVNKKELAERFEKVIGSYAGNEDEYKYHMNLILKNFFE